MALKASARLPLARGRLFSAISTELVISNSGANAQVMEDGASDKTTLRPGVCTREQRVMIFL
jgi:hypothetical protein